LPAAVCHCAGNHGFDTRLCGRAGHGGQRRRPECDDYLSKYQACVDSKVPEAARAGMKQALDQTRGAWRAALATPGGKEGMAAACKQARDAAKTSMSAYGCTDF